MMTSKFTYPKHAVILAAGRGTRLAMGIPKCLVTIGEQTLVAHQLALLAAIENVSIVVGYKAEDVIPLVQSIRPDINIIYNEAYATTNAAYSAYLATHTLTEPYILMAGDLWISPQDFKHFLGHCQNKQCLIGLTTVKTETPVYAKKNKLGDISKFSRVQQSPDEWCCLALLSAVNFTKKTQYIYEAVANYLPLPSLDLCVYEVDSASDYRNLMASRQGLQ